MESQKALLVILDGWGNGQDSHGDAILQANTPFFDGLMANYPHSQLTTHGMQVGLPEGQMGNSEVGHLNIGAGRIVYQDLTKIDKAIADGSLESNVALKDLMQYCKSKGKTLHLLGLVSDGGVHSHIHHLIGLTQLLGKQKLPNIVIHAFLDGRDTDPKSGIQHIRNLQDAIHYTPIKIASLIGRYYAMDRDKRWERIAKAYNLIVHSEGIKSNNLIDAIQNAYNEGVTDEFMQPIVHVDINNEPFAQIKSGDAVLCFNFRTDRLRQLTQVLTQQSIPEFQLHPIELHYTTMTRYDADFKNIHVVFEKEDLNNTLGEIISSHGLTQLRAAETEKYPHVTFFFSGGREDVFPGEERLLIPSPKVATYDLKPSMSARELCDGVCIALQKKSFDFVCVNFANTDMVGHTGVFKAVMEAAETVDSCLEKLVQLAKDLQYHIIIIADHGNGDYMLNPDGSPNTAHSKNPVPCILISNNKNIGLQSGILADVAPTLLSLMQIPIASEMNGKSLLRHINV